MQRTKNITRPLLCSSIALSALFSILLSAQAEAQDNKETDVTITVNKQSIANLRRFSYRTQLDIRTDRIRNHVSDWPFDRNETAFLYSGKISITASSDQLDSLMKQNKPFKMSVFAPATADDDSEELNLHLSRCKILEKEMQLTRKGTIITTYFFSAELGKYN